MPRHATRFPMHRPPVAAPSLAVSPTRRRLLQAALAGSLAPLRPGQAHAAETPMGFSVSVRASGLLNPVAEAVVIQRVTPGSPADAAGLRAGDTVVAIDGVAVAGLDAARLRPLLALQAGEARRWQLRRADGSTHEALLRRPAE